MAMARTILGLAATAMLIQLAMAANYTVGGPNGGWDTSTDLQTWATSQKFEVGDNLIFQYAANHDVVEVTKADYDSCQASNALQSYNDGDTAIPLTSPGKRYFICGTIGHCSQGMKLEVDTLATSTAPAASPSTPPPASSPAAPKPSATPPAQSPELSPSVSPPSPPVSSPEGSPSLSPDAPSTEAPGISPTPIGLSPPPPPPSSATKGSFRACLTLGFSLVLIMLSAI